VTRVQIAGGVLLAIGIIVVASALVLFSRSLGSIRGDFCAWTQAHYAATLELPQIPPRIKAERSDVALLAQLGCGRR
jgi:hypothetical protein